MSQPPITPVSYRMLTPLIRIKVDTKNPLHYQINNNIQIIVNDLQVFQNFNIISIKNFTHQHFLGMASMVFTYNPLMVILFPFVSNYPDHAEKVLKEFLDALALFKTTQKTKFKDGPRIVQSISNQNTGLGLNIRGSDDTHDFQGKNYELSLKELDEFKNFYNKLISIISKLSQSKAAAPLNFFSRASRHSDITEKFVFLSLALESLFSKEEVELSYRFSNRIALLLGNNFEERKRISRCIKNVTYKRRSMIIHGSNVEAPPDDEYEFLHEVIRVSILQFLSLINLGITDPINELDSFLLKQNKVEYEEFKKKSYKIKLRNFEPS